MIVIKATGRTDVRALRKLATQLSADEVEVAPPEVEAVPPRRERRPTVSTLPGASVSPQTRDAILGLRPVDVEPAGDYELS